MDSFVRSWRSLLAAVAELTDEDFARPSGCAGWLVRDLVCHLVVDAQDVLITLATPTIDAATADAASYWDLVDPPTGDDPLDALIPRRAAAYEDPALLLTVRDYLHAYVLEWTLHHLDLAEHLDGVTDPPELPRARALVEAVAGVALPETFGDADALRIATARTAPDAAQRVALGEAAERLPIVIG